MSSNVEEKVTSDLVDYLRTKISDPLGGTSRGWIYPGYPRVDAMMPRIGIVGGGGEPSGELGIGNKGKIYRIIRNAVINVDSRTIATINTAKYSGQKLLAYLVSQVVKVIDKERPGLASSYGWLDAHCGSTVWGGYDEALDLHSATVPIWIEIPITWS